MASIPRKDLHEVGLKVTTPRLLILHILEESSEHLRAEEIHHILTERHHDVGLATIYRVLGQFINAGIVNKHHFSEDHAVFELDRGAHHDHLMCVKCEAVEEFTDDEIENRQSAIAKRFGYEITDHNLYLYGICPRCQESQ